ncbi:dihydroxyacetone kinase subunit DhaL [Lacrimispora sp.]|jgi:dihydroxyacetone kinase phosphoprotein-dependent L subunit|uniref:dihydroxyacetone kinase subunit DhaL n=1 Tax=Lacrimispora sp. TaxID=2719234 RepID=UPI0026B0CAEE|nr:dihydroxyacetone kinase subunit DhaL [Lacrimispora sp.]
MNVDQLNADQVKQLFLCVADRIVINEPYLTEIDMKIGDGDHGTGMELGFIAVLEQLPSLEAESVESVFQELGRILLDTMGGASGVLFGTMFISGVIRREPSCCFGLSDFAESFRVSLDAIMQRGKARVGDKTMVDALEPAVAALEHAASQGLTIHEGFSMAATAAKKGVEYTKEIKARFGRAKYYGDKAIGLQDAGATSVWLIFQAMSDWVSNNLI